MAKPHNLDVDAVCVAIVKGEEDDIISDYVNGRIDFERKNGTLGQVNIGKLSATGAKLVRQNAFDLMKGKRRLAKLRKEFQEVHNVKFDILKDGIRPSDKSLSDLAAKIFPKKG